MPSIRAAYDQVVAVSTKGAQPARTDERYSNISAGWRAANTAEDLKAELCSLIPAHGVMR